MQMSTGSVTELTSSPSLRSGFHDESDKIADEFSFKMTISCSDDVTTDKSDEDFSFACVSVNESPISAEDVFQNGKIKPIFPYFDGSVQFPGDSDDLPHLPPVNKVFVETEDSPPPPEGEVEGPYCVWNRKAVEALPEVCKKSNSTGFSKIWRFREMVGRSNSDGRDAFVFLNGSSPLTTSSKSPAPEKSNGASEKKCHGEAKVAGGKGKGKAKKGKTVETASLSAHYVRNRAMREEGRRRSYLPYRPEVFGFFTNVQGGLSRNVHPF